MKYVRSWSLCPSDWSHPSRGAWIEIPRRTVPPPEGGGRTPRGVRGLKYRRPGQRPGGSRSHPSRGAWIEIMMLLRRKRRSFRRTPRGVRGLKSLHRGAPGHPSSRTPRGVRGLKSGRTLRCPATTTSHPSRGAWIEIGVLMTSTSNTSASHPSRGAWIEIPGWRSGPLRANVAPLAGCVD